MKQSKPFFSIVIPTLNEEKYLPHLLDDLSKQTFKNFEATIVDGGSIDTTVTKALSFKNTLPEFRIVTSKKRNVSYQRNLGGKKSSGQYLLFIDADTRLESRFLSSLNNQLIIDYPYTFSCWFDSVDKKTTFQLLCLITSFSYWLLFKFHLPSAPGCLLGIKRKIFNKMRGFIENIEFAEDRDLIRRCYKKGLDFHFYFKPKYSMSLRRVERVGLIKYLYIFLLVNTKRQLGLKIDRNNEYPMGGEGY